MPRFLIPETSIEVARDALLIDTNVLVAAFLPGEPEGHKEIAWYVLRELGRPVLVPMAVLTEAWGLIMGARKEFEAAVELLVWLNTPGNAIQIPHDRLRIDRHLELIRQFAIDYVDAMLAALATEITSACELRPAMSIATLDTKDFARMTSRYARFSLFDLRSSDEYEIG